MANFVCFIRPTRQRRQVESFEIRDKLVTPRGRRAGDEIVADIGDVPGDVAQVLFLAADPVAETRMAPLQLIPMPFHDCLETIGDRDHVIIDIEELTYATGPGDNRGALLTVAVGSGEGDGSSILRGVVHGERGGWRD